MLFLTPNQQCQSTESNIIFNQWNNINIMCLLACAMHITLKSHKNYLYRHILVQFVEKPVTKDLHFWHTLYTLHLLPTFIETNINNIFDWPTFTWYTSAAESDGCVTSGMWCRAFLIHWHHYSSEASFQLSPVACKSKPSSSFNVFHRYLIFIFL